MTVGHRPALHHVIQDKTGVVQGAAQVTVYKEDGTTLLDQPMYASAVGETTLPNPLIADGSGAIEAYTKYAEDVVLDVEGLTFRTRFSEDHAGPRPHFDVTANDIRPERSAASNSARWADLANGLEDGDTVYFPNAGVYQFDQPLTLSGKARVKITGAGQTVIHQTGARQAGLVLDGCPDATIRDLRFRGPDGTPTLNEVDECAIRIDDGARCTISDCHIEPTWAQAGICCVVGDYLTVDRCRIEGKPTPSVDGHNGIQVYSRRATITNNSVSGFWCNIASIADGYVGHVITGNRCKDAVDVNIYVGTFTGGVVEGNVCEGTGSGVKIGYTATDAVIRGNTLTGPSNNIWANHVYSLVIAGNTIDGSNITLNVDNSDGEQATKSALVVGNSIRNTGYYGADELWGAIVARGRNITVADNLIEWAQQHGISFYAAGGNALSGCTVRNNTIRMVGQHQTATYHGIRIGSSNGESVEGFRIFGNTITSRPRPSYLTGDVVAGQTRVTGLLSTEHGAMIPALDAFEPGDRISGAGLETPCYVTSISVRDSVTGLEIGELGVSSTNVGTVENTPITITTPVMQFGISVSPSSGGVVECWGNDIVGAQVPIDMPLGRVKTLDQNLKVQALAGQPYGGPRLERIESSIGTPSAVQRHAVVLGGVSRQIQVHVPDATYNDGVILLELVAADPSENTAQYYRGVVTCGNTVATKTDLDAAATGAACFAVGAPTWNTVPTAFPYDSSGMYYAIPVTRNRGFIQGYVTVFGPTWTRDLMVRVV